MKNLLLTFFIAICFLNVQAQCTADFTYVQNGPTTYFTDLSFITQGWSTNYSVSYLWDFGDGNTSTLQNPFHTYSNGLYTPCLTVTYFDSVIMNFCTSIYCDSILIGNGPNASWDCGLMGCFDPGTGNGQYSSLAACQAACTVTPSWDCSPNALGCYDPGTGLGQYTTLAACQAACSVTPSWDCGPTGCYDPGTGMGTYTSLASCQSACVINSGLLCDSIVVTGSQTQLTMQVNNFNAFIYHWISMAPDGTVLGEDSMWNNHLVYNSFTIPYDTITTCITYPDAGTLFTCCIDFVWDATTGLWAKMGMQTTINEIKGERKLIKIVDILGKTTTKHFKSNQILFYIYDDGSTEKIYSE